MPWDKRDKEIANNIIKRYEVLAQDITDSRITPDMNAKMPQLFRNQEDIQEIKRLINLINEHEAESQEYIEFYESLQGLLFEVNNNKH